MLYACKEGVHCVRIHLHHWCSDERPQCSREPWLGCARWEGLAPAGGRAGPCGCVAGSGGAADVYAQKYRTAVVLDGPRSNGKRKLPFVAVVVVVVVCCVLFVVVCVCFYLRVAVSAFVCPIHSTRVATMWCTTTGWMPFVAGRRTSRPLEGKLFFGCPTITCPTLSHGTRWPLDCSV